MKNNTRKVADVLRQIVKFGIVGVVNNLVSLGIYYFFIWLNRDLYMLGYSVGFFASVFNAYVLNSKFVFKKEEKPIKALIKTYICYGGTFLLGLWLIYMSVSILNISANLAPVFVLFVTVPLNYLINKYWVFEN